MTINIHQNYNDKLGQPFIVHIRKPLKNRINPDDYEKYEVTLTDGTTASDYVFHDYQECRAITIPGHIHWLSHAMDLQDFLQEIAKTEGILPDQTAGVYFFRKKT